MLARAKTTLKTSNAAETVSNVFGETARFNRFALYLPSPHGKLSYTNAGSKQISLSWLAYLGIAALKV